MGGPGTQLLARRSMAGLLPIYLSMMNSSPSASVSIPQQKSSNALCWKSGLCVTDLRMGRGKTPSQGKLVVVHYVATTADGRIFDSTRSRNKPIAFVFGGKPFGAICEGLMEGLSTMREGGVREVVVPPDLGFGTEGKVLVQPTCDGVFCDKNIDTTPQVIPGNAELRYKVELLKVTVAPEGFLRGGGGR